MVYQMVYQMVYEMATVFIRSQNRMNASNYGIIYEALTIKFFSLFLVVYGLGESDTPSVHSL